MIQLPNTFKIMSSIQSCPCSEPLSMDMCKPVVPQHDGRLFFILSAISEALLGCAVFITKEVFRLNAHLNTS